MTLRFKRNFPLVLLLIGILSLLALTIGNAPIVSYSVNTQALQAIQLTAVSDDLAQWTDLFSAHTTNISSQLNTIQP